MHLNEIQALSIQLPIQKFWVGEWEAYTLVSWLANIDITYYSEVEVECELQFHIDLFYRLYMSNLIQILPDDYFKDTRKIGIRSIEDLCKYLSHSTPFLHPIDYLWFNADICLTESGEDLLMKYNYLDSDSNFDEVNFEFVNEVLAIFKASGVTWSDDYLFPRYCLLGKQA